MHAHKLFLLFFFYFISFFIDDDDEETEKKIISFSLYHTIFKFILTCSSYYKKGREEKATKIKLIFLIENLK